MSESHALSPPVLNANALAQVFAFKHLEPCSGTEIREWIGTFEAYCKKFSLSENARIDKVGLFLRGEARAWHLDQDFVKWQEWKAAAISRFAPVELKPIHLLKKLRINQFTSMRNFVNRFQQLASKALCAPVAGLEGEFRACSVEDFHTLIGISTFVEALPYKYKSKVILKNPTTLEKAYEIVLNHYAAYVESEQDEEVTNSSRFNPFVRATPLRSADPVAEVREEMAELCCNLRSMFLVQGNRCPSHEPSSQYCKGILCYNCHDLGHTSRF